MNNINNCTLGLLLPVIKNIIIYIIRSITTPIYIATSGSPAQIQNILNSIAPGLLTLATVLGTSLNPCETDY